ncbi:AAA family ATPase [candidate division KSB1 bacterium]|nr:AAA family ATPase [candidate division KSB1 bacterium]
MLKEQLLKRSPIRVLEETLDGGLGSGQLGVLTARKGVGKTASLVHIATDKLLLGQNVLHISFADDPRHIITWYEQVFREVAKAYRLENELDVHEEIIRHRLILHFKRPDLTFDQIKANIQQVKAGFSGEPQVIIVDGFPFENATTELLAQWRNLAQENKLAVWFSATLHREKLDLDEHGVPAPVNKFYDLLDIIIMLKPQKDYIDFCLLKSHDDSSGRKIHIKLDPKTLLISNHRV